MSVVSGYSSNFNAKPPVCDESIESAWKGRQRFIGDLCMHYSHFIGSVLGISQQLYLAIYCASMT